MRLATIFFVKVLSCLLLLRLSSGGFPKRDGTSAGPIGKFYTPQEEEVIINVLSELPDKYKKQYSESVWKLVAEKINKLHSSGNPGFPQERLRSSIRQHFDRMLLKDENLQKRLPEDVLQKLCGLSQKKRVLLRGTGSTSTSQNQKAKKQIDLNEIPSDSDSD